MSMTFDAFASHSRAAVDPARDAFAIFPHDSSEIAVLPRAIFVGTGGDLVLRAVDSDADVTLKNVASGQVIDVRVQYVRAAGTTAADLVGLA
jgi:hypothetical protein